MGATPSPRDLAISAITEALLFYSDTASVVFDFRVSDGATVHVDYFGLGLGPDITLTVDLSTLTVTEEN